MTDTRPEFDNTRVLVVGGAGFVGSNLVKMLMAGSTSVRIAVVDNFLSSERVNVPDDSRVELIEGSITNDAVLAEIADHFDFIFHLACYHGNQSSIHDPLADHENNTLTTLKLMNHAKEFKNLTRLVYSSAGCSVAEKTFGDARATTEDDPVSLVQDSPYSISKIIGEFYSVYFHGRHGLPVVRARFQNVYGPGEILGAGEWRGTPATVWRNVTPTFIYKALNDLALPLENEGVATRDFIYVEDICRGLIACALRGESGGVYNIASGKETSVRDLAQLINERAGNSAGLEHLPARPWDSSGKRFGSAARAKSAIGFEAHVGLEEGIEKTIEWTQNNISVINACIKKHTTHMMSA